MTHHSKSFSLKAQCVKFAFTYYFYIGKQLIYCTEIYKSVYLQYNLCTVSIHTSGYEEGE